MKKTNLMFIATFAIITNSALAGQEGFGPNVRIGHGRTSETTADRPGAREACLDGSSLAAQQVMKTAATEAENDCRSAGFTNPAAGNVIRLLDEDRQDGIASFDCTAIAIAECH